MRERNYRSYEFIGHLRIRKRRTGRIGESSVSLGSLRNLLPSAPLPDACPAMVSPKLGPMLRRERDFRFYVGLFNSDSYVRGLRKWWIHRFSTKVGESEIERLATSPAESSSCSRGLVICRTFSSRCCRIRRCY